MRKYAVGHKNKAPTSGNDNLRSGPKPCCDVCLYCRPLADSEGHSSSNHSDSSRCPQAILNSLVVTEENGINQFSGLQKNCFSCNDILYLCPFMILQLTNIYFKLPQLFPSAKKTTTRIHFCFLKHFWTDCGQNADARKLI